jgi:hypothetical protein
MHFIKFRFLGIAGILAATAVFSVFVMLLWNALLPDIGGFPRISYAQAAGILVLSRILFGGMGFGRGGLLHHGNHFRDKWMHMSADDRAEFAKRQKEFHDCFRGRFSPRGEPGASPERESE